MHEHNGIHQAFQYFSASLFHRKSAKASSLLDVTNTTKSSSLNIHNYQLSQKQEKVVEEDSQISIDDYTPFTSRSNSNITISNSISDYEEEESPLPSPSSSTTLKVDGEDEPWRLSLSNDGKIQRENSDYFFMDRQDLYTPAVNSTVERDSYGFKRPTQWIQSKHLHQFDLYYQPILDEQQIQWNNMMVACSQKGNSYPSIDSLELRENVRKGIPNEHRGRTWLHYSGAKSEMEANLGLYRSLVNTADLMGENNEYAEIIQRDLHRTFPDNLEFASGGYFTQYDTMKPTEKLLSLRRILLAFSIHSPHIGYCQSLNYLAGFFLLFVEKEEEAFWMLVVTVHNYMPENMYDVTMEGANMDQAVLLMFMKEKFDVDLWEKLADEEKGSGLPPITLVTNHWFLTMFINILPVETVLRIWDCFFIEGYQVLFLVALTIIHMNKDRISKLQDPIEIFQILQNMPRRLIDCPTLMGYVFSDLNLFAVINQDHIIEKRNVYIADKERKIVDQFQCI